MNKKLLLLVTLISINVFIAGCSSQKTKEIKVQPASTTQTKTDTLVKSTDTKLSQSTNNINNNHLKSSKSMTYKLVKNVYSNKKLTVNYPQITNLSDSTKQKSINEIIKNEALKVLNYYKDSTDEVTLDINYNIKLSNENLLSIQYSGISYSKGAAHPNNIFYTTNINLNNASRLRLADLVKMDENFVNKFKNSSYKSQDAAPDKSLQEAAKLSVNQFTTNDLIKKFNNADSLDNICTET